MVIFGKKNTPVSDGRQTTGANNNNLSPSKLYNIIDEISNAGSAEAQKDIIEEYIDPRSLHNLPRVIRDTTAAHIEDFLQIHADKVPLVSTDHNKNNMRNSFIDDLIEEILCSVNEIILLHNNTAKAHQKWKCLDSLTNAQIVDIIQALFPVISVVVREEADASDDSLLLCVYINDPEDKYYGIYSSSIDIFKSIIKMLKYSATQKDVEEITYQLRGLLPRKQREDNRDLIAVGNGIFDYKSKELLPFSPEHVFLSKSQNNYVENPENPVLRYLPDGTDTGEDWDVETWMRTLSDDPEIVELLWKILGAIIRPHNRWNKSAWLYSESGNSGKGTLCELMRQLCGEGAHVSIPVADFAKDFMLEPLTHASAIIVDENDVGGYIDKAANFKAVTTNDVISINRKYKQPLTYQFKGFMVQCFNEMPRSKDKSESFYRRQLFIPMTKCFTGCEKKYIKDFYLHDKRVLEYVLNKVLNMNYYTLEAPAACRELLNEYKAFNDPVRLFFSEIRTDLAWNMVPFAFLFAMYRKWMQNNNPNGQEISKILFTKEIKNIVRNDTIWSTPNNQQCEFTINDEVKKTPEPLIAQYDLQEWLNPKNPPSYIINGTPLALFKRDVYSGIIRIGVPDKVNEDESE